MSQCSIQRRHHHSQLRSSNNPTPNAIIIAVPFPRHYTSCNKPTLNPLPRYTAIQFLIPHHIPNQRQLPKTKFTTSQVPPRPVEITNEVIHAHVLAPTPNPRSEFHDIQTKTTSILHSRHHRILLLLNETVKSTPKAPIPQLTLTLSPSLSVTRSLSHTHTHGAMPEDETNGRI